MKRILLVTLAVLFIGGAAYAEDAWYEAAESTADAVDINYDLPISRNTSPGSPLHDEIEVTDIEERTLQDNLLDTVAAPEDGDLLESPDVVGTVVQMDRGGGKIVGGTVQINLED